MYLLKPLDPTCTGPTPEELADVLAGKIALDDAVAAANAAIWQNTARPELNSRGLLLADDPAMLLPDGTLANATPGTPGAYDVTPTRYARVLLSDVPVCIRSQPPPAYHSRQAGLAGLRHQMRGLHGLGPK